MAILHIVIIYGQGQNIEPMSFIRFFFIQFKVKAALKIVIESNVLKESIEKYRFLATFKEKNIVTPTKILVNSILHGSGRGTLCPCCGIFAFF